MWENEQKVPYMFKDNVWVGFDNERSIKEKVQYAMDLGLGGMMVWSIDTDDFLGRCGKAYPLLTAVNEALGHVSHYCTCATLPLPFCLFFVCSTFPRRQPPPRRQRRERPKVTTTVPERDSSAIRSIAPFSTTAPPRGTALLTSLATSAPLGFILTPPLKAATSRTKSSAN